MPGCPIRKSTDQIICADPRGLSQLITSFIASESLGIHRVPLFTFFSAYPFASICGCFLLSVLNLSFPYPQVIRLRSDQQRLYCCLLLNFFLPICQRTFRIGVYSTSKLFTPLRGITFHRWRISESNR